MVAIIIISLVCFAINILFCSRVAKAGAKRGLSPISSFFLAFFFSAIFGGIVVGLLGRKED